MNSKQTTTNIFQGSDRSLLLELRTMQPSIDINSEARALLRESLRHYDPNYGLGYMSCAIYDTAWVSLITKEVQGKAQWLFPECFQYILDAQSETGGWETASPSQIDDILNTAGALLALSRHSARPLQIQQVDLSTKISRATRFLRTALDEWDVAATEHVGFEIIVPAMLDLLQAEDPSRFFFPFKGRDQLMKLHQLKMSRFKPEYLYSSKRTTALHSLEAFVGKVNFDLVAHHLVQGSMLGSPSSTAAYLTHASQWDEEAENYLRHVFAHGAGRGEGGMPSAFPTTHFEASWMLSTLLKSGFSKEDLHCDELDQLTSILADSFHKEHGLLGFAPHCEPDVDDTAKVISCLTALDHTADPTTMIERFDAHTHFRTYAGERDPSFTANCNALLALLSQPRPSSFHDHIHKLTRFLTDCWWQSEGKIKDKWNTCHFYPTMLFVEAMMDFLDCIEHKRLRADPSDPQSVHRTCVALFQACARPLLEQNANGSWGASVEETAYGLIILSHARRLQFFGGLEAPLETAIASGLRYLTDSDKSSSARVWIEKVSYASPILTQSYRLAAMKALDKSVESKVGCEYLETFGLSPALRKYVDLFKRTPLFSCSPLWELEASMIESQLLLPLLRSHQGNVFPSIEANDKYFHLLPFFWVSASNRARTYASTSFILQMTTLSLLTYQVDEFMETAATRLFEGRLDELRSLILILVRSEGSEDATSGVQDATAIEIGHRLSAFIRTILTNVEIRRASPLDQANLKYELLVYLQAHTLELDHGYELARPYPAWVRTISADSTSAPFAFAYAACLLSATYTPGERCFSSALESYLAAEVSRHMASMCRVYNDAGSVTRDAEEGTLNSVDFPEFGSHNSTLAKVQALQEVGGYERDRMLDALALLKKESMYRAERSGNAGTMRTTKRKLDIWAMFCDQVDLYGQVYVLKDLSPSLHDRSMKTRCQMVSVGPRNHM